MHPSLKTWLYLEIFNYFCVSVLATDYTPICEYAPGKCAGSFDMGNCGYIQSEDPPLFNISHVTDYQCKEACTANVACWFIEIRDDRLCVLFTKHSKPITTIDCKNFYRKWDCCNEAKSCRTQSHRCRGFWLRHQRVFWSGLRVLSNLTQIPNEETCRSACLANPLCVSINERKLKTDGSLEDGYCELLAFDLVLNENSDPTSSLMEWRCCKHSDEDLKPKFKNLMGKCRGRWRAHKVPSRVFNDSLGYGFTLSKFDCMLMCEENPYCESVFFSQAKAKCVLRGVRASFFKTCTSYHLINISNDNWYGYNWECSDPQKNILQPYDSEPFHFKATCVCLNASRVGPSLLSSDGCVKPLLKHKVTLTSSQAAFWLREHKEVTDDNGRQWTRVFNGETYIWVSRSLSQLVTLHCPKHHCDVYSTVIDFEESCPSVLNRSHWFARPPLQKPLNFSTLPNLVSILDTDCPESGCFSDLSCSNYMRQFQLYHQKSEKMNDIAYNFMIGGGNIYEGRGADFVGAHTLGYNFQSIGIAVNGWFEKYAPSVKNLRILRQLIRCLEKQGKLSKDYRVMTHYQLRPVLVPVPGKLLAELLPNWSHFYSKNKRTRLPHGQSCDAIFAREKWRIIEMICAVAFASMFLIAIGIVYRMYFAHSLWCPVRRSRRRINKKKRYSNILCSVGYCNAFVQINNLWPTNCVIRNSATLQINPLSEQLITFFEVGQISCQCFRFVHMLWVRCAFESLFEFPSLLHNAIALKACRCYKIIFWKDALYLLHVNRLTIASEVIQYLQRGECLCKQVLVDGCQSEIPSLDGLEEFVRDRSTFDVNCILERRLHRFESLSK